MRYKNLIHIHTTPNVIKISRLSKYYTKMANYQIPNTEEF